MPCLDVVGFLVTDYINQNPADDVAYGDKLAAERHDYNGYTFVGINLNPLNAFYYSNLNNRRNNHMQFGRCNTCNLQYLYSLTIII